MNQGLFVAIEGLDGAGTTTQAQILATRWNARFPSRPAHVTAEPTSGPIGALIRQVLRERVAAVDALGQRRAFDRKALALLFAADRLDHQACEIAPLTSAGYLVISDRYVLSSLAYQALDAEAGWVREINRFAPEPDVTFFLDVPVAECWRRIRTNRPGQEIFEAPETLKRVAGLYASAVASGQCGRMVVVPGNQPREVIADAIWDTIASLA